MSWRPSAGRSLRRRFRILYIACSAAYCWRNDTLQIWQVTRVVRALRVVRHSRKGLLAAVIAIAIAAATFVIVRSTEDTGSDEQPLVAVTRRTLTTVVILQGSFDTVAATPLTGLTPGSEVEWLVEDGELVAEGDPLYKEMRVDDPAELEKLRKQEQQAIEEVKKAEASPTPPAPIPTPSADAAAVARATEERAEAVRRLEAVEAEGDTAVRAAEDRLTEARAQGTDAEIQAAVEARDAAVTERLNRSNEVRVQINAATDRLNEALAGQPAASPQPTASTEAQRRLAELRRAAAALTAAVRRAQSGIAQGTAEHSGVVRIDARRVPEGDTAADRVIGRLEPPGLVMEARVEPGQVTQLPDPISAAVVRMSDGPSEFACDRTERVGGESEARIRCFLSAGPEVEDGQEAELRVAVEPLNDVLVVPAGAVEKLSATRGLVVREGETDETEIEIAGTDGTFVAITKGLLENERVYDPKPSS